MSNEQIARIVAKLDGYRWLVLTEHVPCGERFIPNVDKPIGPAMRLGLDSGVVVTAAPFHFAPRSQRLRGEAPDAGGILRTIAYELGPSHRPAAL
jgi:hypothetical protein